MTMMGGDPVIMLDAPLHATERALRKAGMLIDDIDLFEVNEAFASVPTAWLKTTGADPSRLNVNGGAIALGHPLGCTGAKLTATLLYEMKRRQERYGLVSMCVGGGMGAAAIFERC
jgi:acetyl-CoA C-acetyltransferase